MIRPLRQRHRRMITTLGVVLPIAFAAGIAARRPPPSVASLPTELLASPLKFAITEWERAGLFAKTLVRVRLLRESAGARHFAVELSATKNFVKPDLIVYWVAANPNVSASLPDDARLLGAFNQHTPLPIAEQTGSTNGMLVLYNLADQEIVEISKIFRIP